MKCSNTTPILGYQQLWLLDLEKRILISVEFRKIIFIHYVFIDIFTVHSQGRKGRLRSSAPGRQQRYFCGKISLFHSLKPRARDMCPAPFRLIDNWNSVYVLQGYHYFSQRMFFSSCSWPPIAPIAGFPPLIPVAALARFALHALTISCSSARLTLVAVVPPLAP